VNCIYVAYAFQVRTMSFFFIAKDNSHTAITRSENSIECGQSSPCA
jgi:hypothetical protein